MSRALPVLDLGRWYEGEQKATAFRLRNICETIGFFYLAGHGVPGGLVRDVRAEASRFFSLPLASKLRIHFEKTRKQRGYIPLEGESSDTGGPGDRKEALDFTFPIPPEGVSDPVAHRMYGPNLWPDELPRLRPTVEQYFDEMIRLGRTLFEAVAESLDLPGDYFQRETERPIAQLRLLHYPPQPSDRDEGSAGIGTHCDYECFTLLEPGDVAGLEVRDRDGTWIDVAPREGTFVVNLGEMLARWTNDTYRATPHRVVNRSGKERHSIAFFFGTNYETEIACLPTCQGPGRPPRYPPILAGEYLAKRLNEVYGSLPEAGSL